MSTTTTFEDRATGALMGALIGEALGVGPHWYYDLDELHAAHGLDQRLHHAQAGALSRGAEGRRVVAGGLAAGADHEVAGRARRLRRVRFLPAHGPRLLPLIDGTPNNGPGGYTSQSMRESFRLRVKLGKPWGEVGGWADTTEAAERVLAIAVRDARDPQAAARHVSGNTALTQIDATVGAMTTAYALALGQPVQGVRFDGQISSTLMGLVREPPAVSQRHQAGRGRRPTTSSGRARLASPLSPDALLGRPHRRCRARPRTCASSRRGRSRWSTACPAPSITSCRRPITCRPLCRRFRMRRAARHQRRRPEPGACHAHRRAGGRMVGLWIPGASSRGWIAPKSACNWRAALPRRPRMPEAQCIGPPSRWLAFDIA
jgi:hypothetical protein